MKRRAVLTAIIAAAFQVVLGPSPAVAKMGIAIEPTPGGLQTGDVWIPVIQYVTDAGPTAVPGKPHVAIRITSLKTGATRTFAARRIAPSAWQARIRFPDAGVWRYTIQGFGGRAGRQSWDPVTVAPRRNPKAAHGARDPRPLASDVFPIGWSIFGGAALLVTALLLVRVRRSRRP